ncbi:MAG: NUMOD4 domain-containing protein [Bacteroidota bacterium]
MSNANERWRDYLHEENRKAYSISNLGNVRSLDANGNLYTHTTYKNNGYRCIPYRKSNGKNGLIYVHKIMLQVWVENPNDYKRYRFIDRNFSNCSANNLEWISDEFFSLLVRQRSKESFIHSPKRKYPLNAKLSPGKVAIIKKRIKENENRDKVMKWSLLAKQFGINYSHLYRIRKGQMWADIEPA